MPGHKGDASEGHDDRRVIVFRPAISNVVVAMILVFGTVYGIAYWWIDPVVVPGISPFLLAVLGGGVCGVLGLRYRHRSGIRVDEDGLRDVSTGTWIAWQAITDVRVEHHELKGPRDSVVRSILVTDAAGNEIRFGSFCRVMPPEGVRLQDLPDGPLLLAIIAARTGMATICPDGWSTSTAPPEGVAAPSLREPASCSTRARFRVRDAMGFLVLVAAKAIKIATTLAKTVKVGPAAASLATYGLIVSWQFAIAFVGIILIHEFGHVHAMARSGVRVKGVYLIPLIGAAAVPENLARSHWQNAYVAISGPVWGTAGTVACFGLYHVLGQGPFFGAMAAWSAWLNLFNLMPVFPLDGGRVMAHVARSSSAGWSVALTLACLLGSAVLSAVFGYWIIVMMTGIGLIELVSRWRTAAFRAALGLLRGLSLDAPTLRHFVRLVATSRDGEAQDQLQRELEENLAEAQREPMSSRQIAIMLGGVLALAGVLVLVMLATSDITGAGDPLDLFR